LSKQEGRTRFWKKKHCVIRNTREKGLGGGVRGERERPSKKMKGEMLQMQENKIGTNWEQGAENDRGGARAKGQKKKPRKVAGGTQGWVNMGMTWWS